MGYQQEYGHRMVREHYAENEIHFYRIVQAGTDETDLKQGSVGCRPVGVSLEPEDVWRPDSDGNVTKRDGYLAGDMLDVAVTGVCHVELGETVTAETRVVSDSVGRAIDSNVSTVSGIEDLEVVAGTILEGGDVGDHVRIDMDRKV